MSHPQLPLLDPPARTQTGACDGDRPYVPWASGLSPDCRLCGIALAVSPLASYHHFVTSTTSAGYRPLDRFGIHLLLTHKEFVPLLETKQGIAC